MMRNKTNKKEILKEFLTQKVNVSKKVELSVDKCILISKLFIYFLF